MKKLKTLISLVCAVTALALCLTGCNLFGDDIAGNLRSHLSNASQGSEPDSASEPSHGEASGGKDGLYNDIAWRDGDLAAVGFVAGYSYFSDELSINTQLYSVRYKFANAPINNVHGEGSEYYYIVPRYYDCQILIESLELDAQTASGQLYSGAGSDGPILLYANISDIISNVRVTVTRGDESISFSPTRSLKGEGEIMNELPKGILDITVAPLPTTYGTPDENSWPKELADDRPVINAVLESLRYNVDAYNHPVELDMLGCVNTLIQFNPGNEKLDSLYSSNGHYYVISGKTVNLLVRSMWASVNQDITPVEDGDLIKYDAEKDEYSFAEYGPVVMTYYECYDFLERSDGSAVLMVRCWERETSYDDASSPTLLYVIELVPNTEAGALTKWRISDYYFVNAAQRDYVPSQILLGEWETVVPLDGSDGLGVYHLSLNSDGTAGYYYGWYESDIASTYTGNYLFDTQNLILQLDLTLQNTILEGENETISCRYYVDFVEEASGTLLLLSYLDGFDISPFVAQGDSFAMAHP